MTPRDEFLPTGQPVVSAKRSYGELPFEERFGVGVVGLHEGLTMLVGLRAAGLCRPVAGCDLISEKRAIASSAVPGLFVTSQYEELLAKEEVKIVVIYTPDAFHADHVAMAFEAGKHVICTKPLINDLTQAARLLDLGTKHHRRLQVGQSTRFGEGFQRQREHFESGRLGEVEVVDAHYNHRMDWLYEKSAWTLSETHWAYLGLSHPVDLVRWYLGPIREVHAFGTVTALGRQYGLQTPDAISVNLIGENGRLGRVLGNYGFHELPRARSLIECFLMGSKGTSLARYPELSFTYTDGLREVDENYEQAMSGYYNRHELKGMHYGEFCNYADYFASKLLSGEDNSPDLEEGLETVATMDAIVSSLKSGLPAAVSKFPFSR